MILEGNASNEDILDQLKKIEAIEEDDRNHLYHENTNIEVWSSHQRNHDLYHENTNIEVWSSYQIHEGLTLASSLLADLCF
jgi:hypothetical protein